VSPSLFIECVQVAQIEKKYYDSQIFSEGGEGVLIASSNTFSVITILQSVGLLVGDKVSSVMTLANSSFTTVRTV
jgi:hypothetical protein